MEEKVRQSGDDSRLRSRVVLNGKLLLGTLIVHYFPLWMIEGAMATGKAFAVEGYDNVLVALLSTTFVLLNWKYCVQQGLHDVRKSLDIRANSDELVGLVYSYTLCESCLFGVLGYKGSSTLAAPLLWLIGLSLGLLVRQMWPRKSARNFAMLTFWRGGYMLVCMIIQLMGWLRRGDNFIVRRLLMERAGPVNFFLFNGRQIFSHSILLAVSDSSLFWSVLHLGTTLPVSGALILMQNGHMVLALACLLNSALLAWVSRRTWVGVQADIRLTEKSQSTTKDAADLISIWARGPPKGGFPPDGPEIGGSEKDIEGFGEEIPLAGAYDDGACAGIPPTVYSMSIAVLVVTLLVTLSGLVSYANISDPLIGARVWNEM